MRVYRLFIIIIILFVHYKLHFFTTVLITCYLLLQYNIMAGDLSKLY